ncbi:non-ribosomal peptide synthetase [Coleofasciculus sp. FACHB-1120]|uniref:non-ribosomal peptide synthetase n=1 Tax=Coleofasciculus sp. FACHB-1120 TaxID=2692783 RepID=UPI001688907F|nr:non-ribosomal peptide synthetase [Coleofasciculus sp. FACHB-1120]MBD2741474.1 amino acid adenylation domain-containing protein [Coleofasciculus sp. FACHB-1120]
MPNDTIQGFQISPQQKRLWGLQQLDSNQDYQARCYLLIEGCLNIEMLKTSLQEIVERHEILRTHFRCLPGMTIPLQVISESSALHWQSIDLSARNSQEQSLQLETFFNSIGHQPCNFEEDSLLQLSLITLSEQKHILLINLPALCADTATLQHLAKEISRTYAACCLGTELDDEIMQYADISEWQNELLEGEDTEAGRNYWEKQDFSALLNIELPLEILVSKQAKFQPQLITQTINSDKVAKITAFVSKYETSVPSFLLTCWTILLWRLTKQSNLVIGTAFDGRKYEELESALGLFSKYLPIESHLEAKLSFGELLQKIHQAQQEVYQWQEYFSWDLNASADSPFFPVCFEFNQATDKCSAAGVTFSIERQYICIDRFKIKLAGVEREDALSIEFHYDANLFDAADIQRLAGQFSTLVDSILETPNVAIRELKILSDVERQQLIEFNNTKIDFPQFQGIHQRFEQQVEKTPDAIALSARSANALVYEGEQLTYQQLNQRANQLAHSLRKLGVAPEVLVGLYLERSLEMVVGLLGVLKAGGAYVPLDPALPLERLAFILQDTQAKVLLTQQHLVTNLPGSTATVFCLDSESELQQESDCATAQPSDRNLETQYISASDIHPSKIPPTPLTKGGYVPPTPPKKGGYVPPTPLKRGSPQAGESEAGGGQANLAYVIYTSGSTGTPKGVAVEHRQILNYLNGILERLDLPDGASFAMVSTFAADLGNTVLFPSLCTGGCLHIISQDRAADAEALSQYFQQHPIDCLKIVPSHLSALLASSHPEFILPRQRLILGGEASSWTLIEKIQNLAPSCRILNHYGPTETTVGVLTYQVESGNLANVSKTVPLGRPLANTQIYILDNHLQPVPIGVSGEVYIGGDNLARGYLNQPELTAKKFISNPFLKNSGVISSPLHEPAFPLNPTPPQPAAPAPLPAGGEGLGVGFYEELTGFDIQSQESEENSEFRIKHSKFLYKTGDLARYLPDGNIEFLGRIDHQVKIRGFRIELGEIEAVLKQHPAVEQAVVVVREDVPGDKRLVVYSILSQQQGSREESTQSNLMGDLRSFVKAKLPEYMIPSAFVILKTLPLTANGKVDREKLPAPEQIRPELAGTFVAPRTNVEEILAGIWAEAIGIEQVGIYDNFFELGGHSLLATQVISRLRDAFNVELPLRQFFDFPTVADLAVAIAQKLAEQTDEEMMAQMLAELDEISEEEVREVLAKEGVGK